MILNSLPLMKQLYLFLPRPVLSKTQIKWDLLVAKYGGQIKIFNIGSIHAYLICLLIKAAFLLKCFAQDKDRSLMLI